MDAPAQQFAVRSDYLHALAGVCQRFVGFTLVAEPNALTCGTRRLTEETPTSQSPAETLFTWTCLRDTIARGAAAHHRLFHRCFGPAACEFDSGSWPAPESFTVQPAFAALNAWVVAYSTRFDEVHMWPPAVKAACVLQARVCEAWHVDELAKAVGTSRATLERSFRRIYGSSAQQYHRRLRLRRAATAIRSNSGCIDGVILELGCRSPKDAYRAFRQATGMTLAAVRQLTDEEFFTLMSGPLKIPVPERPLRVRQRHPCEERHPTETVPRKPPKQLTSRPTVASVPSRLA